MSPVQTVGRVCVLASGLAGVLSVIALTVAALPAAGVIPAVALGIVVVSRRRYGAVPAIVIDVSFVLLTAVNLAAAVHVSDARSSLTFARVTVVIAEAMALCAWDLWRFRSRLAAVEASEQSAAFQGHLRAVLPTIGAGALLAVASQTVSITAGWPLVAGLAAICILAWAAVARSTRPRG